MCSRTHNGHIPLVPFVLEKGPGFGPGQNNKIRIRKLVEDGLIIQKVGRN